MQGGYFMINVEKHLMQWCEECNMFAPCCFKLREQTEDKKSFCNHFNFSHFGCCPFFVSEYFSGKFCERCKRQCVFKI